MEKMVLLPLYIEHSFIDNKRLFSSITLSVYQSYLTLIYNILDTISRNLETFSTLSHSRSIPKDSPYTVNKLL